MNLSILLFVIVALVKDINSKTPDRHQLEEVYHWDILDYEFPPGRKEQALASGSFIPNKNSILSLAVWRNKMFVSVYRFSEGIASSLNYFSLNTTSKSPVLIPYPSFEANYVNEDRNNRTTSLPSVSSIINAGHHEIDKCNRMWIIDSGYTDQWGAKRVVAPPAIVIFDLTTDTLVRRFVIPSEFINSVSILSGLALDFEGDSCDNVHAYVSTMFRSVIVYSFKKDKAWNIEHPFMGSDPHECNFFYEHLNFQWNYGVFGLAVGGIEIDGSKRIYFSPLSSTKTTTFQIKFYKTKHTRKTDTIMISTCWAK